MASVASAGSFTVQAAYPGTSFVNAVDFGAAAAASSHDLNIRIRILATASEPSEMAQARLTGPTAVQLLPVTATAAAYQGIANYGSASNWDTSLAGVRWQGFIAADPSDPTGNTPLVTPVVNEDGDPVGGTITPLPAQTVNGSPLWFSQRSSATGNSTFVTCSIRIPAGAQYPITIGLADMGIFGTIGGAVTDINTGALAPLVIPPEPISALLLLAGLPMLRRRR